VTVVSIEATHIGEFLGSPRQEAFRHARGLLLSAGERQESSASAASYDFTGLLVQIGVLKAKSRVASPNGLPDPPAAPVVQQTASEPYSDLRRLLLIRGLTEARLA
jgi:hypothetical protein